MRAQRRHHDGSITLFILACALFIGAVALYQRWRNRKD